MSDLKRREIPRIRAKSSSMKIENKSAKRVQRRLCFTEEKKLRLISRYVGKPSQTHRFLIYCRWHIDWMRRDWNGCSLWLPNDALIAKIRSQVLRRGWRMLMILSKSPDSRSEDILCALGSDGSPPHRRYNGGRQKQYWIKVMICKLTLQYELLMVLSQYRLETGCFKLRARWNWCGLHNCRHH